MITSLKGVLKPPLNQGPFATIGGTAKVATQGALTGQATNQLRVTHEDLQNVTTGDPAAQIARVTQEDLQAVTTGQPTNQIARVTQEDIQTVSTGDPTLQIARVTQQDLQVVTPVPVYLTPIEWTPVLGRPYFRQGPFWSNRFAQARLMPPPPPAVGFSKGYIIGL